MEQSSSAPLRHAMRRAKSPVGKGWRRVFDLFSSDHCPFRFNDEKGKLNPKGKQSFRWIPNGIPGVETRLPILFSEGVSKGRIDINRFVALTSTNHAKTYGLYRARGRLRSARTQISSFGTPSGTSPSRRKSCIMGRITPPMKASK